MATHVNFEEVFSRGNSIGFAFRFDNGDYFEIISLDSGIMVIKLSDNGNIHSWAKKVAGCFEKDSNFYGLKAIKFEFRGIYVTVTAENAIPEEIVQLWNEKNKIKT